MASSRGEPAYPASSANVEDHPEPDFLVAASALIADVLQLNHETAWVGEIQLRRAPVLRNPGDQGTRRIGGVAAGSEPKRDQRFLYLVRIEILHRESDLRIPRFSAFARQGQKLILRSHAQQRHGSLLARRHGKNILV